MNKYKYSVIIDTENEYLKIDEKVREKLSDIINTVDLMYCLQNINYYENVNLENFHYAGIIKILGETIPLLNSEGRKTLDDNIKTLESGNFDIINIPLITDNGSTKFLFGKIISPGNSNQKRYAAAVGAENSELDAVVKNYDRKFTELYSCIPFLAKEDVISDYVPKTDFNCMDVFMLGGELNRKNKPISVFFSGIKPHAPKAMSKVALFTNIYFERFRMISVPLGMKFIRGFDRLYEESADLAEKMLLFWLRGHDLGHMVGEDNLGVEMKDKRFIYYSLHELKSDMISLYLLSSFGLTLSGRNTDEDRIIYNYFIAEALRYIRRGKPELFPDTSSAFLAVNYLMDSGAIYFDVRERCFEIYAEKCYEAVIKLCDQLVKIFRTAARSEALNLYNEFTHNIPGNLLAITTDSNIPFYIDLEYQNKN